MGADRMVDWMDAEQLAEMMAEGIRKATEAFCLLKEIMEAFARLAQKAWEAMCAMIKAAFPFLVRQLIWRDVRRGRRQGVMRRVHWRVYERTRLQGRMRYLSHHGPWLWVRRRSERCFV